MQERLEETVRFIEALESDWAENPEKLSVANWNRALLLVLRNQCVILEALAKGGQDTGEQRQETPKEAPEEPQKETPEETPKETLDEKAVAPPELTTKAVELFELEKLNHWLDQPGGTPFQIRGEFAFVKARVIRTGMGTATLAHLEKSGFSKRLGVVEDPGLHGEIVLYQHPEGSKRSWEE